jgi:hypothetical protein
VTLTDATSEVEVERQVGVVYARQLAVDEVAEVDGERGLAGGGQERRVPGDILGHGPDDAVRPRLGGAAAEDAVVLDASAGGAPLEDGEGDRRRCAAGRGEAPRRGVRGRGGGLGEGEPEGVGEQERRAWAGAARGRAKRPVHLEVGRRTETMRPRRQGTDGGFERKQWKMTQNRALRRGEGGALPWFGSRCRRSWRGVFRATEQLVLKRNNAEARCR